MGFMSMRLNLWWSENRGGCSRCGSSEATKRARLTKEAKILRMTQIAGYFVPSPVLIPSLKLFYSWQLQSLSFR